MSDRFPDWRRLYADEPAEQMPWFLDDLDHDVAATLRRLDLRQGRVLDLGSGPGTQACALAALGFQVTGSDLAPDAVRGARARAAARGLAVTFVVDDVLATALTGPFDLVLDRGCFHVLPPDRRDDYAATVHRLLTPGGRLLLKTFSHAEPGEGGPYRLRAEDLRESFAERFDVESIVDSEFDGTLDHRPKALFAVLQEGGR